MYSRLLVACCSALALGLACSSDDSDGGDDDASNTTVGAGGAGGTTTTTNASGGAGGTTTGSGGGGGNGGSDSVSCSAAEGSIPSLGLDTIASDLTEPVFVAQAPGDTDRLFIVEQPGTIKIVQGDSTSEFLDVVSQVSRTDNERGMFGLAFHPDYLDNGLFYVHYSASEGTHGLANGTTVLSEFSVSSDPDVANVDSERVILTVEQPNWNHNGGMIAFGPNDGFLYLGLGDGGGGGDPDENGQNPNTLLGAMLRLDVDGRDKGEYSVPSGNMAGGLEEIWDKGLRNPWRFSFEIGRAHV